MEDLIDIQMKKRMKQEFDKEEVLEELKKQMSMRKSKSASFLSSV